MTTLNQQMKEILTSHGLDRRRASKGRTFDPCHGCGQPPENWQGRPKDGVCESCASALKLAKQIAETQDTATDTATFAVPSQSHWLPYLPERDVFAKRTIQPTFWELAMACSLPAMNPDSDELTKLVQPRKGDHSSGYFADPKDARVFRLDVAEKLQALYASIHDGLKAAYVAGEEHGASLLQQLASGDMTASKFNEIALRRKD